MLTKISKLITLSIVSLLILTGCSTNTGSKEELDQILSENNYIIVDVRTKEEYSSSHIKGAINIPYDEINENIELDKNKKILVYCQTGKRSEKAFVSLTNIGYDVFNLGGIDDIDLPKE